MTLKKLYSKYEREGSFKKRSQCVARFEHCLKVIKEIFGDDLKKSEFRKRSLFYSLYCVVFDALYIMPKSEVNSRRRKIPKEKYTEIRNALNSLGNQLKLKLPRMKFVPFIEAFASQTDNIGPRRVRHRFVWNAVKKYLD